jgi:hypothetical protein
MEGVKGGSMAERVRVRDLSSQEGSRLLRTVRRDAGSAVTACRTNYGLTSILGSLAWRNRPRAAKELKRLVTSDFVVRSVCRLNWST